jgi:hypothetical protein
MTRYLNADRVTVLSMLRLAALRRRQPTTLAPDGYRRWFSLAELAAEGLVPDPSPENLSALGRAARALRAHGFIAGRTQFTVTRYTLLDYGRAALAEFEERAGLSEYVTTGLALEVARDDMVLAEARVGELLAQMDEARKALGMSPGDAVRAALQAGGAS